MKGWSEGGDAVSRSVGAAATLRGGADTGRVEGEAGSWGTVVGAVEGLKREG